MNWLANRRRVMAGSKVIDPYDGCITLEFTETIADTPRRLTANHNNVLLCLEKLVVDGIEQPIQKNYQYTFGLGNHKIGWKIKDGDVKVSVLTSTSSNSSFNVDNALVTIPSSIVSIASYAMRGAPAYCPRRGIVCYATTPPNAADNAALGAWFFPSESGIYLYVPAESVEAYKSATGWSQYANKIIAIPQ